MALVNWTLPPSRIREELGDEVADYFEQFHRIVIGNDKDVDGTLDRENITEVENLKTAATSILDVLKPLGSGGALHFEQAPGSEIVNDGVGGKGLFIRRSDDGITFFFRNINSNSSKVVVTQDDDLDEVRLDLNEPDLDAVAKKVVLNEADPLYPNAVVPTAGNAVTLTTDTGAGTLTIAVDEDQLSTATGDSVIAEPLVGTKDGVNTTFTSKSTPVNDVAQVIHRNRLLIPVTGTPTSGQFSLVSGTYTLGRAPQADEYLVASYNKVAGSVVHFSETLIGTKDGVNTVFNLATTPVARSQVMIIHRNAPLVYTDTVGPSSGQFAIDATDTTKVTFGRAPKANEHTSASYIGTT